MKHNTAKDTQSVEFQSSECLGGKPIFTEIFPVIFSDFPDINRNARMTEGAAGVPTTAEEPVQVPGAQDGSAAGAQQQRPRQTGSAVRVLVVTDTASETSEYASVQVPAVEEMLLLLLRQNVPLDSVAVIDVAGNFEQRFWVVTQTMLSYPPYPQLYVADQRFGTLRGLFFFALFSFSFPPPKHAQGRERGGESGDTNRVMTHGNAL